MCVEFNRRDACADFGVVRVGESNATGRLLTSPTALVGLGHTRGGDVDGVGAGDAGVCQ